MGYLGATVTQVLTCSLRDVTIAQDRKLGYRVRMTSRTGSTQRIWGNFERVELRPALGEDGWLSLARGGLGQVSHEIGGGQMKKPE